MSELSPEKRERITTLLSKRLIQDLTPGEEQELEAYCQEQPALRQVMLRLEDKTFLKQMIIHQDQANLYTQAHSRSKNTKIITIAKGMAAALVATVLFLSIRNAWPKTTKSDPVPQQMASGRPRQAFPGNSQLVMTLADGKTILPDSMSQGQTLNINEASITKTGEIDLSYNHIGTLQEGGVESIGFNTLETPQRGRSRITLPDGTKIWLNNRTTLRFPTAFTDSTREVEIIGEAYLDVARDPGRPFFVRTTQKGMQLRVEVLGTTFNISSYPDDTDIRTALITGKVRVIGQDSSQILAPNEQLIAGPGGVWQRQYDIPAKRITAWQHGLFNFDGDSLTRALRTLARWYGKDLEISGPLDEKENSGYGVLPQSEPLDQLLDYLSKNKTKFHYTFEGNKMIISH